MSEAPPRRFSGGVAVPDFFSHSLHERMVGWLGLVFFLLFPDLEVFGDGDSHGAYFWCHIITEHLVVFN